jgi:hypothetical protein
MHNLIMRDFRVIDAMAAFANARGFVVLHNGRDSARGLQYLVLKAPVKSGAVIEKGQ